MQENESAEEECPVAIESPEKDQESEPADNKPAVAEKAPAKKLAKKPKEALGLLKISGEIGSVEDLLKKIMAFAEDKTIKGVMMVINSGGGACGASELLCREIKELSKQKPVVTLIVNACFSGAYWAATASDWIIAQATSGVGCIGVKYTIEKHKNQKVKHENYTADVDITVIHAGKFKVIDESDTPAMSRQELEIVQAHTDKLYETFTACVAYARNLSLEMVSQWADGKRLTGVQALELGLIDQIGGYSDAKKKLEALIAQRGITVTQKLTFVE
jgi:protease-4